MKLVNITDETVTLKLSNTELDNLISAHTWARGGLEELLGRDPEPEHSRQVEVQAKEHDAQLVFLHKLSYVRAEKVWNL